MRKHRLVFLLGGLVLASACTDEPLPFDPVTPVSEGDAAQDTVTAPPADGVGTFGVIDEIKPQGQGLVVYQTGLDFEAAEGVQSNGARHELAVGARHQKLQVQLRDSTEIWVDGEQVPVDSLEVGMNVLVVGRVTGAALHADVITDLSDAEAPPDEWVTRVGGTPPQGPAPALEPVVGTTSMCMGQRLPDGSANVLEFQGCWGGPSASDHLSTGFIPVFCPLIGCFGITGSATRQRWVAGDSPSRSSSMPRRPRPWSTMFRGPWTCRSRPSGQGTR